VPLPRAIAGGGAVVAGKVVGSAIRQGLSRLTQVVEGISVRLLRGAHILLTVMHVVLLGSCSLGSRRSGPVAPASSRSVGGDALRGFTNIPEDAVQNEGERFVVKGGGGVLRSLLLLLLPLPLLLLLLLLDVGEVLEGILQYEHELGGAILIVLHLFHLTFLLLHHLSCLLHWVLLLLLLILILLLHVIFFLLHLIFFLLHWVVLLLLLHMTFFLLHVIFFLLLLTFRLHWVLLLLFLLFLIFRLHWVLPLLLLFLLILPLLLPVGLLLVLLLIVLLLLFLLHCILVQLWSRIVPVTAIPALDSNFLVTRHIRWVFGGVLVLLTGVAHACV
jgi:hypothetical protein